MSPRKRPRTAAQVAQGGKPRRSPRGAKKRVGTAAAATYAAAPTLPEPVANGHDLIAAKDAVAECAGAPEAGSEPPPPAEDPPSVGEDDDLPLSRAFSFRDGEFCD